MASFQQLSQISQNQQFLQRVNYAMNNAAAAVYNEATTVTGHSTRASYATRVANGNFDLGSVGIAVISSSPTIAAEVTNTSDTTGLNIVDSDIQNAVNSIWNLLAGV